MDQYDIPLVYGLDCCDNVNIDFTKVGLLGGIDVWVAVFYIVMLPTVWTVVIYFESHDRHLTSWCGSPQRAVVCFAAILLLIIIARDLKYSEVVQQYNHWYLLQVNSVLWSGYLTMLFALMLMLASFKAAGFYYIFFGEYFGIYQDKLLTFPFNLFTHPLYIASTLSYFGLALVHSSAVGIVLTFVLALSYTVSGFCEGCLRDELLRNVTVPDTAEKVTIPFEKEKKEG